MASIPERRGPSRRSRAEGTHELAALSVIVVWVLGVGLVAASPTITTTSTDRCSFCSGEGLESLSSIPAFSGNRPVLHPLLEMKDVQDKSF
jgi:hypothetical protein